MVLWGLGSVTAAQESDPTIIEAIDSGADWLLEQQTPSGAYPWTVGGELTEEAQGAIARGMLLAYTLLSDPAYLESARATGDYLVEFYPTTFDDGDPEIFPLDPLFLHELSWITDDPTYADFVQTNLWDKLSIAEYGNDNDQDVSDWADDMPVFDDYITWTALDPLFRALPAIAAYYAGEPQLSDGLMEGVVDQLEEVGDSEHLVDLPAIAAAIVASAHTGFNLDPTDGRWADFDTTQEFVDYLVGYQREEGDWPYDTGEHAADFVGDVSTTSWAVIALKTWSTEQYEPEIALGIEFILSLQQEDGQILTNPGYSFDTETGVQVHAEALIALGTVNGTLMDQLVDPPNRPPVAQDDAAATVEPDPVVIDVLANDSDPDGTLDPASVQIEIPASDGTTDVDPTTGVVTYTPDPGFSGLDSFSYSVMDDEGAASNVAIVSLTVTANIQAVVLLPVADTYVSLAQPNTNFGTSGELQFRLQQGNYRISYLKFDVAELSGTLETATLRLHVTTASGDSGNLYLASNDFAGGASPWTELQLVWTNADLAAPLLGSTGGTIDSPGWIEFDVTDALDGEGFYSFAFANTTGVPGAFSSREGAFPPELVLEIVGGDPVNQPPQAADDTAQTDENIAVVVDVLTNDADLDGSLDPSSVVVVSAPANGTTSVNSSTGAITYTPNLSFDGVDIFSYVVDDDQAATSDPASVTVTVTAINTPPVTRDDLVSTLEQMNVIMNILANDSDPDGSLDPTSVEIVVQPGDGSAVVDPLLGTVSYTPDPGFSGIDSFKYRVYDNEGAVSAAAEVTITVEPVGGSTSTVLYPTHDSYTSQRYPNLNTGHDPELRFRQRYSSSLVTYLKFELAASIGEIESATLRLYVVDGNAESGTLYLGSNYYDGSSTPWTEDGLTWATADLTGTLIAATSAPIVAGSWLEFDVTSALSGVGEQTFAFINAPSSSAAFSSRQGSNPPELVVHTLSP